MAGFIKEGSIAYGIPGSFAEKKLRRCPVCGFYKRRQHRIRHSRLFCGEKAEKVSRLRRGKPGMADSGGMEAAGKFLSFSLSVLRQHSACCQR